jgi:hypothetical protein
MCKRRKREITKPIKRVLRKVKGLPEKKRWGEKKEGGFSLYLSLIL